LVLQDRPGVQPEMRGLRHAVRDQQRRADQRQVVLPDEGMPESIGREALMFLRLIVESIRRRLKSRAAALGAVALGAGAASGLVMILLGVGDRISEEFRSKDANIVIVGNFRESELGKLRAEENRWRNQLRFVIPELRTEKSGYVIVGRDPDARWTVDGKPGVLAGVSLGIAPGTTIDAGRPLVVTGTVSSGGEEDSQIIVP